ncbi:conserved hypothetical protein [Xylella fastidiosa M12]|nr:conserved hypothetical protein [Xylella fastidiosa M12]
MERQLGDYTRFFIDMSAAETKFNVIYYQLLMQHS